MKERKNLMKKYNRGMDFRGMDFRGTRYEVRGTRNVKSSCFQRLKLFSHLAPRTSYLASCISYLVPRTSYLVILLLLVSCKPTVPRDYLQPDKMADILYDYHLADAMAQEEEGDNRAYDSRLYRLAALKKHGVSEADFDSSMVYYTRHADWLHKIYVQVAERMEKDATALGATVSDLNRMAGVEGEALNIWPDESSLAMMPMPPYNYVQHRIEADTAFHAGERFTLSFDTQFVFQEGSRNAIAQLVVRFNNDSVGTRVIHISSDSHYDLEILDKGKRGVSTVEALFYLDAGRNDAQTTLKLLVLNNVKLLKVKLEEKKDTTDVESNNTVGRDSLRDKATTDSVAIDELKKRPLDPDRRPQPMNDRPLPLNGKPLEMKHRPQDIQVR